MQQLVYCWE